VGGIGGNGLFMVFVGHNNGWQIWQCFF